MFYWTFRTGYVKIGENMLIWERYGVNMFSFIKQYIKNPRYIGAVAPSGKRLAEKMMTPVRFDKCRCIVEYGPGTGVFTREILKRKRDDTVLVLIEQNTLFYEQLKKEFKNVPNMYIFNEDAQNVNEILHKVNMEKADYVISGLPFASLPQEVSVNILNETKKAIGMTGKFITFQYFLFKLKFFKQFFGIESYVHELVNLPPAYVITMRCRRKSGTSKKQPRHGG